MNLDNNIINIDEKLNNLESDLIYNITDKSNYNKPTLYRKSINKINYRINTILRRKTLTKLERYIYTKKKIMYKNFRYTNNISIPNNSKIINDILTPLILDSYIESNLKQTIYLIMENITLDYLSTPDRYNINYNKYQYRNNISEYYNLINIFNSYNNAK